MLTPSPPAAHQPTLPPALGTEASHPPYPWEKSMPTRFVFAVVALTGWLALTDSASAFGRRWERRRAELYGSLNASLSARVDAGVAQQSAAAEQRLSEANKAQIAAEAVKLNSDIAAALAQLKQQATEAVA